MQSLSARLAWFGLVAMLGACAVKVSRVPLENSKPEGVDVYFYGTPNHGGKRIARAEDKPDHEPLVMPKPPSLQKKPKKLAKVSTESKLDAGASAGDGGQAMLATWAGRYHGTDTVLVSFPGVPEEPQVDDKAKLDVAKRADDRVAVTVVDSQRGEPLCTIEGTYKEGKIDFEPGQECFSDMLGIPVDTSLVEGTGSIEGEKLVVEFSVEMSIDTPSGLIEGDIDYHFQGNKVESESD